jgi:hypothetical protein
VNCEEARLLMLDRPEERRRGGRRNLARHLAQCDECRREFADLELTAEYLNAWTDAPVGPHQQAACVARLNEAVRGRAAGAPKGAPSMPIARFGFVLVFAAIALLLGPVAGGRGVSGISADIGDALEAIGSWRAEGTATPPIIPADDSRPCNHVEVWFRKPDCLVVRVDRDLPSGPLFSLTREGRKVSLHDPQRVAGGQLLEQAASFHIDQLFDVSGWVARRSIMRAPVRDLGLARFGDRDVRKIRVVPQDGWLADSAFASEPGIQILVDAETMLPVLLETKTHGSVVILDFDYGTPFPEEMLAE